ncbi:PREDICTED: ficolin-2-like [Branchiostoma belcheri]|uniref:Ficolin-2-like n=1 Tax=Branchiostoma belcheri TaxID=7741 RepID=A0A6P4Z535_BRABE|nr:PREDICTED: ficolin-2-like [Branchiostoma belcheri]
MAPKAVVLISFLLLVDVSYEAVPKVDRNRLRETGEADPTASCTSTCSAEALENLLHTQGHLETAVQELQDKTVDLQVQVNELNQNEQSAYLAEQDLRAALATLQTTVTHQDALMEQQDSTIQQQAASLQQLQGTIQQQAAHIQQQYNTITEMQALLTQLANKVNGPRDCLELLSTGHTTSGVYTIYPDGGGKSPVHVYCDMDTDGGGWTVFQKRQDGSVDFYLNWQAYKTGFGDLRGEFWLGNDNLHRLTSQGMYELRVDLEDFDNNATFAEYSLFRVEDEMHKYKLTIQGYSGTAGDGMANHNNMYFSTKDRDNEQHGYDCADRYQGAWWYGDRICHRSNLNGQYHAGAHQSFADGINWQPWLGNNYSLKHTEMKIRPN